MAAWWNSTTARIMVLNRRARKLTYPMWNPVLPRQVGVPKPDNPAWDALTAAYEQVASIEMLPLSKGPECEARRVIDRAAAQALGVDEEQLAACRRLLAVEPTISNRIVPA